jgi:hypothetical protein
MGGAHIPYEHGRVACEASEFPSAKKQSDNTSPSCPLSFRRRWPSGICQIRIDLSLAIVRILASDE